MITPCWCSGRRTCAFGASVQFCYAFVTVKCILRQLCCRSRFWSAIKSHAKIKHSFDATTLKTNSLAQGNPSQESMQMLQHLTVTVLYLVVVWYSIHADLGLQICKLTGARFTKKKTWSEHTCAGFKSSLLKPHSTAFFMSGDQVIRY